jgi:hypothetical protein
MGITSRKAEATSARVGDRIRSRKTGNGRSWNATYAGNDTAAQSAILDRDEEDSLGEGWIQQNVAASPKISSDRLQASGGPNS